MNAADQNNEASVTKKNQSLHSPLPNSEGFPQHSLLPDEQKESDDLLPLQQHLISSINYTEKKYSRPATTEEVFEDNPASSIASNTKSPDNHQLLNSISRRKQYLKRVPTTSDKILQSEDEEVEEAVANIEEIDRIGEKSLRRLPQAMHESNFEDDFNYVNMQLANNDIKSTNRIFLKEEDSRSHQKNTNHSAIFQTTPFEQNSKTAIGTEERPLREVVLFTEDELLHDENLFDQNHDSQQFHSRAGIANKVNMFFDSNVPFPHFQNEEGNQKRSVEEYSSPSQSTQHKQAQNSNEKKQQQQQQHPINNRKAPISLKQISLNKYEYGDSTTMNKNQNQLQQKQQSQLTKNTHNSPLRKVPAQPSKEKARTVIVFPTKNNNSAATNAETGDTTVTVTAPEQSENNQSKTKAKFLRAAATLRHQPKSMVRLIKLARLATMRKKTVRNAMEARAFFIHKVRVLICLLRFYYIIKEINIEAQKKAKSAQLQRKGTLASISQRSKWFPLKPQSSFITSWNVVLFFALILMSIATPFTVCIVGRDHDDSDSFWIVIEDILDVIFGVDIIVNFLSAYYDNKNKLITSHALIVKRYAFSWFLFDFAAIFPFQILLGYAYSANKFIRLFRLPRLYDLSKLMNFRGENSSMLSRIQDKLKINIASRQLMNVLVMTLIASHIVSCLWYQMSRFDDFSESTWVYRKQIIDLTSGQKYVVCLYWAFQTLFVIGYGDILAFTYYEQVETEFIYYLYVMDANIYLDFW